MKYYIGFDGGGTKTKCVLSDDNFNVISETTGDASNYLIRGADVVSETLLNLLTEVTEIANISLCDIDGVVIGTTGAGRRTDAEILEKNFLAKIKEKSIELNNFRVESDARIALEGAFKGNPGSILIAGTGSIMFGKDRNGNIHRVGGFGRFIGDEGSGYSIGRMGLTAVAKHLDGRGEKTLLTELLKDNFSIIDSPNLITEVYTNNFDIASVTPLVIEAASKDDDICVNIIEQQSTELLAHVIAMQKLLNEDVLHLCLIGSTITTDNIYANLFRKKVDFNTSGVNIIEPQLPPALGAVVMAKNLFG